MKRITVLAKILMGMRGYVYADDCRVGIFGPCISGAAGTSCRLILNGSRLRHPIARDRHRPRVLDFCRYVNLGRH